MIVSTLNSEMHTNLCKIFVCSVNQSFHWHCIWQKLQHSHFWIHRDDFECNLEVLQLIFSNDKLFPHKYVAGVVIGIKIIYHRILNEFVTYRKDLLDSLILSYILSIFDDKVIPVTIKKLFKITIENVNEK